MRYLVIGAGGTGGCIAGYMAHAGKDVTLIARGKHLEAMNSQGLKIIRPEDELQVAIRAKTEADYVASQEKADVIFVCVKGYSLESTYDLIRQAAHNKTVVIPVLNIYGTGEKMAKELPGIEVLNGCIYIAGEIASPGVLKQSGSIFRVVFGRVDGDVSNPVLREVAKDLQESGITPLLSEHIRLDTFQKYSFVSPMAAVGAYWDSTAGDAKKEGPVRQMYIDAVKEIDTIAKAMGISLPADIVEINLSIMDGLTDDCTASMQKDLAKGGSTEMDGLVFQVVRMGKEYQMEVPVYQTIARKLNLQKVDKK